MTEPPSLRRAGLLPRDKDGWDVGTVPHPDGRIAVRVHRSQGDVDWGVMIPDDEGGYTFKSSHSDTATSNGCKGTEDGLFGAVVEAAGGTLPYRQQQTLPDLGTAVADLKATGRHRFDAMRDAARAFAREVEAAMGRQQGELDLQHVGPDWTYVLIDHSHPNTEADETG